MDWLILYLGDIQKLLPPDLARLLMALSAALCGFIIGAERELRDKPAGLRTLMLISLGASVFTMVSMKLSEEWGSPGYIAAQIVTGVGFLGAGAILQQGGTVVGLTTGATIWATAAIGVVVGCGYVLPGFGLTILVLFTLIAVGRVDRLLQGACRYVTCRVVFEENAGKTEVRLRRVLDENRSARPRWKFAREGERHVLILEYCDQHPAHRQILYDVGDVRGVVAMESKSPATP